MIRVACLVLGGNEREYVQEALENNQLSNGTFVKRFEAAFADYIGVKHALATANGTVALHLTLRALGIGSGDEVIVPNCTYVATANAVKYCNGTPVFVDVDRHWCLDPNEMLRKITPKTKAVIPVHLYGCPCEMDDILDLASDNDIKVIEDSVESFGSSYKDKMTGSIGLAGTFSFFANKTITTGEGGMITTNDTDFYEAMLLLRGQGVDPARRYWHKVIGYNYRMTDIQGAIGLAQLEKTFWHIAKRREVYEQYYKRLIDNNKIEFQPDVISNRDFVRWMVSVTLTPDVDREEVAKRMLDAGVETRPVFPMMTELPMYKSEERFPISENLSKHGLCLPTHAELTEGDINLVCETLTKIIE